MITTERIIPWRYDVLLLSFCVDRTSQSLLHMIIETQNVILCVQSNMHNSTE